MPTRKTAAVDPVRTMKPGVIQETHRCEQVSILASVNRRLSRKIARVRPDLVAFTVLIQSLRLHEDRVVMARQNIRQTNRHLQRLMPHLDVATSLRILFINC